MAGKIISKQTGWAVFFSCCVSILGMLWVNAGKPPDLATIGAAVAAVSVLSLVFYYGLNLLNPA